MGLLLCVAILALVGWYFNYQQTRDVRLEGARRALFTTVELLTSRSEDDLWPKLLESAIQEVPGAEMGSIRLRQGDKFRFVAEKGFGKGILGIDCRVVESIKWHGSEEAWRRGEPRIIGKAQLERVKQSGGNRSLSFELNQASQQNAINRMRSNLCVPIVLDNEVVAEINLDSSKDKAFNERSIKIAQQYALQATALVASLRERNELETRVREFEVIEALSAALRGQKGLDGVSQRLVEETSHLTHSDSTALMLLQPDQQSLRCYAMTGFFKELNFDLIPKGKGVGWEALESRAPIWRNDVYFNSRAIGIQTQEVLPYSQIAVPMLNSRGEALGVLVSGRNNQQPYTERDVRVLDVIANIASNTLERVWASEHLQAELQEKQALLQLSQMLESNSKEHIGQALEYVRQLVGADAALIAQFQDGKIQIYSQAGMLTPALQNRYEQGWKLEEAQALDSYLAQHQLSESIPGPFAKLAQELGIKTSLSLELGQELRLSRLVIYRFAEDKLWSAETVELTHGCARILGAVISRVEGAKSLEDAYEGALRAIGIALEARDRETGGHTDRVARMAELVGRELSLSALERRDLRWGAYLHDIGKLAIPDSILLKPGKLTAEEFATMKTHAALGDDLVRNLPFVPQVARQVVRHHHERMDGRGYPDGLSAGQIPLASRIFAICDVFDALCSERPYKSAMTPEAAAHELWQMAHSGHLDPRLVEVFLKTQNLSKPKITAVAAS